MIGRDNKIEELTKKLVNESDNKEVQIDESDKGESNGTEELFEEHFIEKSEVNELLEKLSFESDGMEEPLKEFIVKDEQLDKELEEIDFEDNDVETQLEQPTMNERKEEEYF